MKKVVKKRKKIVRLLTAEKAKQKCSAVVQQIKKNILTVTMKAGKQTGTLEVTLEEAKKEVDEANKERHAVIREEGVVLEGKNRAEYDRDGL